MEVAKEQRISDPAFSITVPVRDRGGSRIRNCMKSLEIQTLQPLEIIVADYGSTEQGHEAIMKTLDDFDCSVYYYRTDEVWSLAIARNMGIRRSNAQCRNIAVIDADLILEPRVIEVLSQAHASRPRSYISCFIRMLLPKIWPHYKEFVGNCMGGQSQADRIAEYRKLYPGNLESTPDNFQFPRDFAKLKNMPSGRKLGGGVWESAGRGGLVSAPREWFFKVRGFDERMKFWGSEDGDLWKRAELDGMDCYRINDLEETDAEIYHQFHKDCISGHLVNGPWDRIKLTTEENRQILWNKMIATRDNTLIRNNDNWGLRARAGDRDRGGQRMDLEKPWEVWDSEEVDKLMRLWWGPINGKKGRHQKLMKEVSELITGRTVLDVACGPGHLLSFLKKDIKYLGVDSSPTMISRARSYKRKASFILGSAYDLSNFNNADTVVCVDLIRHLPDTWPVLEQLWMKTLITLILVVEIGEKPITIKSKRPKGKYLINRIETMSNMMNLFNQLSSLNEIEKIDFDKQTCIFRLWKRRTAGTNQLSKSSSK